MSATVRMRTKVLPGHRLEITAPELPEGEEVEVSVKVPVGNIPDATVTRFERLAEQWRRDTAALSSISRIAMHPSYQEVIGMGESAIPLVLRELRRRPGHWFWALRAITGEDPVDLSQRGNLHEMSAAWLKWGEQHGYLP